MVTSAKHIAYYSSRPVDCKRIRRKYEGPENIFVRMHKNTQACRLLRDTPAHNMFYARASSSMRASTVWAANAAVWENKSSPPAASNAAASGTQQARCCSQNCLAKSAAWQNRCSAQFSAGCSQPRTSHAANNSSAANVSGGAACANNPPPIAWHQRKPTAS